jgi:hypothetical protein
MGQRRERPVAQLPRPGTRGLCAECPDLRHHERFSVRVRRRSSAHREQPREKARVIGEDIGVKLRGKESAGNMVMLRRGMGGSVAGSECVRG